MCIDSPHYLCVRASVTLFVCLQLPRDRVPRPTSHVGKTSGRHPGESMVCFFEGDFEGLRLGGEA